MEEKSRTAVYHGTIQRRAVWELDRLLEVIRQYKAGLLTKEEVRERGLPIY